MLPLLSFLFFSLQEEQDLKTERVAKRLLDGIIRKIEMQVSNSNYNTNTNTISAMMIQVCVELELLHSCHFPVTVPFYSS